MSQDTGQDLYFNEELLSQIPALQELIALGYEYFSPQQALESRGGKRSEVLLEEVLRKQLQQLNRIHYMGREYDFSNANIKNAINQIKNIRYDGLQKTNEKIYNLITLGTSLEQSIDGNKKSFTLNYIDWKTPSNNCFHVVPEFTVERNRKVETVRPDIVLFVNGIPLAVIECKSPNVEIEQAVSQNIRNQGNDYIPKLFTYVQLIMAVNKNVARYATAGTPAKFWSIWNELEDKENEITALINKPLNFDQKDALFSGKFSSAARNFFDTQEKQGGRLLTEQDKAIYSLCRPERLLDLTYRFILFESGIKKIARYQQFFVVRSALARMKHRDDSGKRSGGMIYQTQGSGKSLTMVMLTRALILDEAIVNPRIVLVTDRRNLDKQLGNTFKVCGFSKKRATSGSDLVEQLKAKVGIITTLIHKFNFTPASENYIDESSDIFVLVDESHRTNFGPLSAKMRNILPNACYIGFTGTPLIKKKRNNFVKFGDLIEPHYSIRQAVKDKAVLPLLYEGRHVVMEQNKKVMDLWFERHTPDLNEDQKADLKKKYAHPRKLNEAEQVIYTRAFDISNHYRVNWKGTGFKAQLVASSKLAALKYHQYFKHIGVVTSEVIISPPGRCEGHDEVNENTANEVSNFWGKMIQRFDSEEEYNKQIIDQFKNSDEPEILIVVDKLLTGFNAPLNTVLYLCRGLREHTLLQAIARVNRLHEGKEFGYIVDYVNILGNLDKALVMYDALKEFDEVDLLDALISVEKVVQTLPQYYSHLWDLFREVKNRHDLEAFERLLADKEHRDNFYGRLSDYRKALYIALSTERFIMETDQAEIETYKNDLKVFQNLKKSVEMRYADAVDYRDHEPKIKKLLDTHIYANEVVQIVKPTNILERQSFDEIKQGEGIYSGKSKASRADTIAHLTQKVINSEMRRDPAFYGKFSKMIQRAIDDFNNRRLTDAEYFKKASDIREQVVSGKRDDVPESIREDKEVCAYYGVVNPCLKQWAVKEEVIETISVEIALAIQRAIKKHWKVDFWVDGDTQKNVINEIDDFFYDEIENKFGVKLNSHQMDEIIEKTMQIAENRRENHEEACVYYDLR